MKKIVTILIVGLTLIIVGLIGYILMSDNKKVTITFNTDMDIKLDSLKVNKGESINLPMLERDGYDFLGWYINDEKIDSNYKFDKTSVLNAKWGICGNSSGGGSSGGQQKDFKPLIYLYPEKEMDIEVKLGNLSDVTTIYPKYNNSWKVKAYPSGKLIDKNTNRELYGLYWEGRNYPGKVTNEGFIVKGDDTASFLEEKLAILGLNEREAEEFIIYWLPQIEHNNYNYIRFAEKDEIDDYMPLTINPKPDTVIRILMEFMPLESTIKVQEQKLEKAERNGFVAVEWGGSKLSQNIVR